MTALGWGIEEARAAVATVGSKGSPTVVVPLMIGGALVFAELRVDQLEHERRASVGLGSITSTGLLHALWQVPPSPGGVDAELSAVDLDTLSCSHPAFVQRRAGQLVRLYRPAVELQLLAVVKERAAVAVQRALAMPPVFRRTAIWVNGQPPHLDSSAFRLAAARGIGLIGVKRPHSATVIRWPSAPQAGVPSVYRWWIAELAYEELLSTKAPTLRAEPLARRR